MSGIRNRSALYIFFAIALLILAQVSWWVILFTSEVNQVHKLKSEVLTLKGHYTHTAETKLTEEAEERRFMFLSESAFFVFMTLSGLYLLYRAHRNETQSKEIQKNFIQMMSHESKTPLTAAKLRLEALRERADDPVVKQEIELSLMEVRRLTSVFDKAMSLNRIERHAFQFEQLRLSEIVQEIVRRLEPVFKSQKVSLSLDLDSHAIIKGDFYALQSSVQCLIENACYYNKKDHKEIIIETKRSGSQVKLIVKDNGPGIAIEEQARIFERFFRGKQSRQVAGSGLGLFIAKTIVEAHNGILVLEKTLAGTGTQFSIKLPTVRFA